MNRELLSSETQKFIKDHENHDPFDLALKYKNLRGIPVQEAIQQIVSRRKARRKLPEWYAAEGVIFPPPLSMEQCSSEATAKYKAGLICGSRLADLTGGAGVDAYYFSKRFAEVVYVEQDQALVEIAGHNFRTLKANNIQTVTGRAEEYASACSNSDAFYLDPSRRTERKVFMMADSQPDAPALLPKLFARAERVLIKLSPLMDIEAAVRALSNIYEIHVVAVDNDCKETLYLLKRGFVGEPKIYTANISGRGDQLFSFFRSDETAAEPVIGEVGKYLYDANTAVMKAGAFKTLCAAYGVQKLAANSHLYTSGHFINSFPGRKFIVEDVQLYSKRAFRRDNKPEKANLATRNFPATVERLRDQTGIKDGGEAYLFFTTDRQNRKIVIKARKT